MKHPMYKTGQLVLLGDAVKVPEGSLHPKTVATAEVVRIGNDDNSKLVEVISKVDDTDSTYYVFHVTQLTLLGRDY